MKTIFKVYFRTVLHFRWWFLLVMFAICSATALGIYVPVFYKNIANGFAQPYSPETFQMMLDNFWMVALFYAGIWFSWRLLETGIIPVDAGGMRLLDKQCFAVLKQQKFNFFENSFSGSLIKQASRFSRSYEAIIGYGLVYLPVRAKCAGYHYRLHIVLSALPGVCFLLFDLGGDFYQLEHRLLGLEVKV